MRTIGVVTVSRSDYGLYVPILRRISADPDLELRLLVSGMHLAPEFGATYRVIEEDGFAIDERVHMLLSSDAPEAIATAMGVGTIGFAQVLGGSRPDILLVLGDRFEMHAAVVAALPFALPVAHIHGGESSEGVIDEPIRHSITKMSHLHFVSTGLYRERIVQMGEEPWRVMVSGAPGLDAIRELEQMPLKELEERIGISLGEPTLLVTHHPVTLQHDQSEAQLHALLSALRDSGYQVVFTAPNADTGGRAAFQAIDDFVAQEPRARFVTNLGSRAYFTLMASVEAMVGNSSSGIIEAASFALPVVNIGSRQQGRLRGPNVIDVGGAREEIHDGIRRAVSPEFRAGLKGLKNPYGDGHAAERIVTRLKEVELDQRLLMKKFHSPDRGVI